MFRYLTIGLTALLTFSNAQGPPEAPREIRERVKLVEQGIAESRVHSKEVKAAVAGGADYYGQPLILGSSAFPKDGHFTFWLSNANASDKVREFTIDTTTAAGQTAFRTVLFAFELRTAWVGVYDKGDDPNVAAFVAVYP